MGIDRRQIQEKLRMANASQMMRKQADAQKEVIDKQAAAQRALIEEQARKQREAFIQNFISDTSRTIYLKLLESNSFYQRDYTTEGKIMEESVKVLAEQARMSAWLFAEALGWVRHVDESEEEQSEPEESCCCNEQEVPAKSQIIVEP